MTTMSASTLAAQISNAKPSQAAVVQSIKAAAQKSGVDFSYLLNQAKAESSLNPNAKAKTSSATGLFQFIKSTWLEMMHKYGDEHGFGKYTKAIERDFQGRLFVADPQMEQEILNLRTDPKLASLMAAELASENQAYLEKTYTGTINDTELYFAHFLGARGASEFLNAHQNNPQAKAADLFPSAAVANKNVFFSKDGATRSLDEVYSFFDNKFSKSDEVPPPLQKVNTHVSRKDNTPYQVAAIDHHHKFSPKIRAFISNPGFTELYLLSNFSSDSNTRSSFGLGHSLLQNLDVTLFGSRPL